MRGWVAKEFESKQFVHGRTYSGHSAMAAAVVAIAIYKSDGLIERAAEMGAYLMEKALELQEKHKSVGDVRGKGLCPGWSWSRTARPRSPSMSRVRGADVSHGRR